MSSVFTLPHRLGPHHCGGPGEPVGPQHGEAGAGLRGAGAVLGDALVDGVVVLADAVDGQRAAGERDTERSQLQPGLYHTHTRDNRLIIIIITGDSIHLGGHTHTRDNRLIIIIITGDSIHLGGQAEACAHLRNNAIIINGDSRRAQVITV